MPCGRALWARIVLASSQSRHVSPSPHSPVCVRAVCVGCRIGRRVTGTSEQCEECKCPASAATSTSSRACNICLFVFVCSTQLSGEKKMPPEYHRVMQCRTPYFVRVCLRAQPTFEPADPLPLRDRECGRRQPVESSSFVPRPSRVACCPSTGVFGFVSSHSVGSAGTHHSARWCDGTSLRRRQT